MAFIYTCMQFSNPAEEPSSFIMTIISTFCIFRRKDETNIYLRNAFQLFNMHLAVVRGHICIQVRIL